jgi:hypothetical protein
MLNRIVSRGRLTAVLASALLMSACGSDGESAPEPPVNVAAAATSGSATSLTITWGPVAGATGYRIRRTEGTTGGTPVDVVNTLAGTAGSFTDSGLLPRTTYRYQIATIRGTDTSTFSVEVTGTTAAPGQGGPVDVTADITTNTTWTPDRTYRLTRIIYVANGATLTILPGTTITGGPLVDGVSPPVTALVVLRGGRLVAEGTRTNPIIFTSSAAPGSRAPGDWGGVVIIGNATSNRTGRTVVEGPSPVDTLRWDGGTLDNDNSGSLNFVRIEFAGAAGQANVELNCLSMYAVGSATRVQNVECLRGLDDSFEWFGGTVDGRNLVSFESGDDHFDAAEGYRGRVQYMIAVQTGPRVTPRPNNVGALSPEQSGFEVDGCGATGGTCAQGFNSTPFTVPVFANFTIIGPGPGVLPTRAGFDGGLGANIRRGSGGVWVNGIIARWPESAMSIFQQETINRLADDSLDIRNLFFTDNARNSDPVGADAVTDPLARRFFQQSRWNNRGIDSATTATEAAFVSFPAAATTIANDATFDFTPATGSPARTGGLSTFSARIIARTSNFFGSPMPATAFRGAADPAVPLASQWWTGWTSYRRN